MDSTSNVQVDIPKKKKQTKPEEIDSGLDTKESESETELKVKNCT